MQVVGGSGTVGVGVGEWGRWGQEGEGGMGGLFCSSVASGGGLRTESDPRFRLTAGEAGMDQP